MLFSGGPAAGSPPSASPQADSQPSETLAPLFGPPIAISATPTPTATPTASSTPTLGPPMAIVLENSVCRGGPSASIYEPVIYLTPGQVLPIDGRNAPDTYWRVVSAAGRCYLWQEQTDETGDIESVPVVPDPPTPTPEDSQPPQVSVSHTPSGSTRPTTNDPIAFQANATDNVAVARIEIWVQGPKDNSYQQVKVCLGTAVCSYQGGPYSVGTGNYYAIASDAAGNQSQTATRSFTVYPLLY